MFRSLKILENIMKNESHHHHTPYAVRSNINNSPRYHDEGAMEDDEDDSTFDSNQWTSKFVADDLLKVMDDPERTVEFVRTHNPLVSQMSTFLSRKLRMVLTNTTGSSAAKQAESCTSRAKMTTTSLPPKAVLAARLFCAAADGDASLLQDTIQKIRLWHQLSQNEERERKEAIEEEAIQRAKRKAEAAQQRKIEQAHRMEERDARRALTTTMLAVHLKEETHAAPHHGHEAPQLASRPRSTGLARTLSQEKRGDRISPTSVMMTSATSAHSIVTGGVASIGEWAPDWGGKDPPSTGGEVSPPLRGSLSGTVHSISITDTINEVASQGDSSSRRSSLAIGPSRTGSMIRNEGAAGGRRRSSGYFLSDQLHRITSVPSMAGSEEDEESNPFDIPLFQVNAHLSANNLSVLRNTSRRSSVSDHVDFMHDDSTNGSETREEEEDDDVFDAGAEQARNLEALEQAINNAVPFLHMPFNILHYAAYSNSPEIVELILANQDVIEKLGATVSAAAKARVYRYNAGKQIAHASSKGQAKSRHGLGNIPPHNDPSSIHYYTHFADGKPVLTNPVADGCTPLHFAASYNNPQMLRLLLAAGADPKICRGRTITPLFDCMWLPGAAIFTQHVDLMKTRIEAINQVNQYLSYAMRLPGSDLSESVPLGSVMLSTTMGSLPALSATFGLSGTCNNISIPGSFLRHEEEITASATLDLNDPVSINRLLLTSGLYSRYIDARLLKAPIPWRKDKGAAKKRKMSPRRRQSYIPPSLRNSTPQQRQSSLPFGINLLPVREAIIENTGVRTDNKNKAAVKHTTTFSVSPNWMFDGAEVTDGDGGNNAAATTTMPAPTTSTSFATTTPPVHPPFHAFVSANPLYASMYLLLASGSDPSFVGCGSLYPPPLDNYHNPLPTASLFASSVEEENHLMIDSMVNHRDEEEEQGMSGSLIQLAIPGGGSRGSSKPLGKAAVMRFQNSQNKRYTDDLVAFQEGVLDNVRREELVQRHRRATGGGVGANGGVTSLTGGTLVGVEPVPKLTRKTKASLLLSASDYSCILEETLRSNGGHSDQNELSLTGQTEDLLNAQNDEITTPRTRKTSNEALASKAARGLGDGGAASSAVSQFLRMRFLLGHSSTLHSGVPNKRKGHERKGLPPIDTPQVSPSPTRQSHHTSNSQPAALLSPIEDIGGDICRLSMSSEEPTNSSSKSQSLTSLGTQQVPLLVGFSLPPMQTARPSLSSHSPIAAGRSRGRSTSLVVFGDELVPPSSTAKTTTSPRAIGGSSSPVSKTQTSPPPPLQKPPIPISVGDFVILSADLFMQASATSSPGGTSNSVRGFDEAVVRATAANIPSRYAHLQSDTCRILTQKRQVGMSTAQIEEYCRLHQQHSLKTVASASKLSTSLFKDKARLISNGPSPQRQGSPATIAEKMSAKTPVNLLGRQSIAVSFARLPKITSSTHDLSRSNQQSSATFNPSENSSSHKGGLPRLSRSDSQFGRQRSVVLKHIGELSSPTAISPVPSPTTTTTSASTTASASRFHVLLRTSVVGRVTFVGKLPNVLMARWIRSRHQTTAVSPGFEGLVSKNAAVVNSALSDMMSTLHSKSDGGGGGEVIAGPTKDGVEEWFVGLILERRNLFKNDLSHEQTDVLGNCDGTYFGNGKRYFNVAETVGSILHAERAKSMACEISKANQRHLVEADSLENSSNFSRASSFLKAAPHHHRGGPSENTLSAHEELVVASKGDRCAVFVPLCLVGKVYADEEGVRGAQPPPPPPSQQHGGGSSSGQITAKVLPDPISESMQVRNRWTQSWKQAVAKYSNKLEDVKRGESKKGLVSKKKRSTEKRRKEGYSDATKELKALLRDYNAKLKAEEAKYKTRV